MDRTGGNVLVVSRLDGTVSCTHRKPRQLHELKKDTFSMQVLCFEYLDI